MGQVLKIGSKKLSLENWKVHHPNGKHMFTCGEKKAYWYLNNSLATEIAENSIKLNFVPKGFGYDENDIFGLAERKVRCVVSGLDYDLQRHHVVPYCYRTHFKREYKSKNHHDVVLVNDIVHANYEYHATEYKNELAGIYGVKTLNEYNSEYSRILSDYAYDNRRVVSKLYSLFRSYDKIPYEVVIDNFQFISKVTGISYDYLCSMNYIQLYKLYQYAKEQYKIDINKFKYDNRNNFDHAYHLVKKLDSDEKIEKFIKLWRQHFIDTMEPQYMPEGWSIDFKCKVDL